MSRKSTLSASVLEGEIDISQKYIFWSAIWTYLAFLERRNCCVSMNNRPICSMETIKKYLDYLEDAFLFRSAKRYDIKGKRYFGTNLKYYATDIGLRNAKLNFRQYERSHLMENIIYNELIIKGYSVDIGIVEVTRKIEDRNVQSQHEIDFIVNNGSNKIYIQSSLNVDTEEKRQQEIFSLKRSGDFYKKIVVLYGNQKPVYDDNGILYIGIIPFIFSMENILN